MNILCLFSCRYPNVQQVVPRKKNIKKKNPNLFNFSLQVSQLDTLLQVPAVLLSCQVQLLLFFMEELQQILNSGGHVDVTVAQQLHAWRQRTRCVRSG